MSRLSASLALCSANRPANAFHEDSNVIPSRAKMSGMRPLILRSFVAFVSTVC